MPDIQYPPQLPVPQRSGYGFSHVQPFVRTQMASGRAKQRRGFTNVPSMLPVSWYFNNQEAMLFEAWFRYSINDGVDWFVTKLRTPLDVESDLGDYRCRFTEMYTGPELHGCLWRYSASLEVFHRPTLPPGWELHPEYLLHADIIDRALNIHWPEFLAGRTLNLVVTVDGQQMSLLVSQDGINLVPLQVEV